MAGITSRPAHPGETIYLFGIGFGPAAYSGPPMGSPPVNIPAGEIVGPENGLHSPIQIMFGDTPATLTYQGLAPGFVGLYLFKVVVPNVPSGDAVPLTFTQEGVSGTQTLYTAIQD